MATHATGSINRHMDDSGFCLAADVKTKYCLAFSKDISVKDEERLQCVDAKLSFWAYSSFG